MCKWLKRFLISPIGMKTMAITEELLDQLIKDYKNPEDLIGENGFLKRLIKHLLDKAMRAEMTDHLSKRMQHSEKTQDTQRTALITRSSKVISVKSMLPFQGTEIQHSNR